MKKSREFGLFPLLPFVTFLKNCYFKGNSAKSFRMNNLQECYLVTPDNIKRPSKIVFKRFCKIKSIQILFLF